MDRSAPSRRLNLEWVFGYESEGRRNNVFYNYDREIVYFAGRVCIVFDTRENRQRFFTGHSHPVTCLCIHPRLILAASGQFGGDDAIFVWDTRSLSPASKLTCADTRGVIALSFSSSGMLLGSVCSDANSSSIIFVWNWSDGQVLSSCSAHSSRVLDLLFDPFLENRFVTCGVKHLKFWSLHGNALICSRGRFGRVAPIQTLTCLSFGANDRLLYAGSLSGDIYVWNDNILQNVVTNAHLGPVICTNTYSDGFVSGGKDGVVAVWGSDLEPMLRVDLKLVDDGYEGASVRSIRCSDGRLLIGTQRGEILELTAKGRVVDWIVRGHGPGTIHALAVHPRGPVFATAGNDRTIRLWNYVDKRLVAAAATDAVVRCCDFTPDGLHLAVGFDDGTFDVLSTGDLNRILRRGDRDGAIASLKFAPSGSYLAIGGNDSFVDVYHVDKGYHRAFRFSGCSGAIRHLDWSIDSIFIRVDNSDDHTLVFVAPDGNQVGEESVERVEWSTWTCLAGKRVDGIRGKLDGATDASSVDAFIDGGILAVGESIGLIKLFRFPTLSKGAKYHRYVAHSHSVTNVRFSFDKRCLVSTGGRDQIVCLWRLVSDGRDVDDLRVPAATESPSDESDSELSDSSQIDSDVETELQMSKERWGKSFIDHAIERSSRAKNKIQVPDVGLVLRFAFGYRGFDCRSNVVCNRKGEIVYSTSILCVVLDRDNLRQRFYRGHANDVVAVCVHPRDDLIASAELGAHSSIHVWSHESMESVSIVSADNRITCLDFSEDGTKLIGLGVDSSLVVWDWRKGSALSSVKGDWRKIFAVKWMPHDNSKFVTVGRKHLKLWQQTNVGFVCSRGRFDASPRDTLLCIGFGHSADIFVTGGSSGRLHVWQDGCLVRSVPSHSGPVFTIHSVPSGFVSGGKDGRLCLWDEYVERCLRSYVISNEHLCPGWPGRLSRDRPPIRSCFLSHSKIVVGTKTGEIVQVDKDGVLKILTQSHAASRVHGLCTHPSRDQIFTVGQDGFLRSWDLGSGNQFMLHELKNPASCVAISSDGLFLAVGYYDGCVSILNLVGLSSASPIYQFRHRSWFVSDVKFSPNCKFLAVACNGGFVDVYLVPKSRRIGVCEANSCPVLHLDWDSTSKFIRIECSDGSLFYFEAPHGRRVLLTFYRVRWATTTCVKSDEIRGIDGSASEAATDVSPTEDLLAMVDSRIKLYRFPLLGKSAKFRKYNAQSARINNVKWTYDGRHLITTGGTDGTVMVWQRGIGEDGDCSDDTDAENGEGEEGYDSDVELEKTFEKYTESDRTKNSFTYKFSTPIKDKRPQQPPPHRLHLEHVHGYRGSGCRNNVHYINDGSDVVYHAGRVGIVQNMTTGIQSFYTAHEDDIVCLALDPNSSDRGIVATGGSDSWIHVWHVLDLATLSIVRGASSRAIVSLGFSADGKTIISVTTDAKSMLNVWNWRSGICTAAYDGPTFRCFDAQFFPTSDRRFVTIGVRHVKFWRVLGSEVRGRSGRDVDRIPTFLSLAFTSNKMALTGSLDGAIYVWRESRLIRIVTNAHSGPIFSLHTSSADGLVVSGAKEIENENCASVKLWDSELRRCKPFRLMRSSNDSVIVRSVSRFHNKILVGTSSNCIYEIDENTNNVHSLHECHSRDTVSLCAHPQIRVFASTSADRSLRFWDLDSNRLLANLRLPYSGTCVDWSDDGEFVAVGLSNGELLIFRWSTLDVCNRWRNRSSPLKIVKFSPDSSILALGFASESVDLIRLTSPLSRLLSLSFSGVLSIDFSADSTLLRVCNSCETYTFSILTGRLVSAPQPTQWSTCTNPFIGEVLGVWSRDALSEHGSSIDCLRVNQDASLIATGDNLGRIKLFSFPCPDPFAKYNKCGGHSGGVKCICFTHDNRFVVTSGLLNAWL